ncbi:MAG: ABC transporter permease, partial [Deltaproteobacteria bacterium]|nr:ABC transporter permease [Deltaproteobacteria bacterium]
LGYAWIYVWLRNFTVYKRAWKTNLIPPFVQPISLLLIMGFGVGHYVGEIDGMPYLVFVTAGILVTESLLRAAFECTYASFYRMKYQNTFDAIISTPVTPYEVAFGEVMWGATKSLISSTVLFAVMFLIRVIDHPGAFLAFPIIVLGGINFAAISLVVSSRVTEFEHFQFFFAVLFPLMFLCGTYFPLNRLPELFQYVLWVIPLTSVVDVIRGIISGESTPFLGLKILYIFATTVTILEVAMRSLGNRLID